MELSYRKVKRFIDLSLATLLIIVLLPALICIPLSIKIFMGGAIFFTQPRIGLDCKLFQIYKFRTMRERSVTHNSDEKRITRFGRILRISRIDELPQLYNIIKGDMSFIGPRPLLPDYIPFYTKEELLRHTVRPGLSGLSQIAGSYFKWEDQFAYDLDYVKDISFTLDLKIFIFTIKKLLTPSRKLISGNSGRLRLDQYRQSRDEVIEINQLPQG